MFQQIAKHRANDASNDVHRPPLFPSHTHNPVIWPRALLNEIPMCKSGLTFAENKGPIVL